MIYFVPIFFVFVMCLSKFEAPLSVLLVTAVALMASPCEFIAQYIRKCVTEQNLSLNKIILFIQISAVAYNQSSAFTYLLLHVCLCLTVADKGPYNSSLS